MDLTLSLIAAAINFAFVIVVFARASRSAPSVIFALICLSVFQWNACGALEALTGKRGWFYFSFAGAAFIPTLMFHFIVALTGQTRWKNAITAASYVFSAVLAASSPVAATSPAFARLVEEGLWDKSYLAAFTPLHAFGAAMLVRGILGDAPVGQKSRLGYVLAADAIGIASTLTDHVQTLGLGVPALGYAGSVLFPLVMAAGLFRHGAQYDMLAQTRTKLGLMNEMAAGLAHELRNPLGSIKGAARILSARLDEHRAPGCREYLDVVSEEADRLNAMLLNFQHFTRPLVVEKHPVRLNEMVAKAARLAEAGAGTLRITMALSDPVGEVSADPSMLRQVFLNIIKNSAEACGPCGKLSIASRSDPPWVRVDFTDNGGGISDEAMGRMFEPFFTTKPSGMGLGLSISRRIIEAHGGRIEAERTEPGGARFSIFLPI